MVADLKKSFFIIILVFLFFSCSKKQSQASVEGNQLVNIFLSKNNEAALAEKAALSGSTVSRSSAEKTYMPENLKTLLNRPYFSGNQLFYIAEKNMPEKLGLMEASGFYSGEFDTAAWVDSCLVQVEEERIADLLSEMEAQFSDSESGTESDVDADELTDKSLSDQNFSEEDSASSSDFNFDNKASVDITDKNGRLAFSEFEKEKFLYEDRDDKKILIYASDGIVSRSFYNKKLQLEKKESWIIKNADNAELEKSESFYYSDSGKLLSKECRKKDSLEISFYSDSGLINKKESYVLLEDDKKILSTVKRTFNGENQLINEESINYYYTDESYKDVKDTYEQKYVYSYNDEGIPPDFKYYEDGKLKMHNKYAKESGTYTSQIYFDESYSVKTYYEKNVRIREVYFIDGLVRREKIYDKKDQ